MKIFHIIYEFSLRGRGKVGDSVAGAKLLWAKKSFNIKNLRLNEFPPCFCSLRESSSPSQRLFSWSWHQ